MEHVKLIIIGAGPAGLAAAVSAVDNGVSPDDILVLERDAQPGGTLNQCIHAGFGLKRFGEELTGPEYARRFIKMAEERRIRIECNAMVLSFTADREVTFVSPTLGYTDVTADAVILAMGCRERTRGALSIPGSRPSGVYTAGSAQRFLNVDGYLPGHRVVILGSGDIGLIMARRLTLEGAKVEAVCEIMPYSSGLPHNITQCLDAFNIPLKLSHTVVGIHGKERLESVTIAAVDETNGRRPIPGTEETVECDTLLLSVGLIPENELTRSASIPLDKVTGGATVNQDRETEAEGIYACGNVLHVHDIVDYVSEEAEIAGRAAAQRVLGKSSPVKRTVTVSAADGIRYTVPERLDLTDESTEIRLFFRVSGIEQNVSLLAKTESGEVLAEKKCLSVAPGEMEFVTLSAKAIRKLIESGENVCVSCQKKPDTDKT